MQYNDETVTNVDLTLGDEIISCRGASSDAASPVGLADSGGAVEIECFFDTDQVAGACEGLQLDPKFANGEHELGAQITTSDGTVRQALATQVVTLRNSNYVIIDHNPGGTSLVVEGVTYYGGPTTDENVNTFDVCPVAFDGTVVGAIGLRGQTDTKAADGSAGTSLTFLAHRRSWLYGEFWGVRRTDDEAPFTFTVHSAWNGRNALSSSFSNDGGIEDIADDENGGHWIIQDGVISDPDGLDITDRFVPGDEENQLTQIGPIYFDFNAPRVTDASEVTIEGSPVQQAFYSGKRATYDGRSQRIWISGVSEGGSGGGNASRTEIVAVGDCSVAENTDTGADGAGTAFVPLVEDANAIGDLPEDDPVSDDLSDDGGVQCYTAELQSITDPLGNSRALNNVRIQSASNFGVDRTPPAIEDLVPDEELVLMEGAELTFEVEDPEIETGEDGSGINVTSPDAYWGPSTSWSQRYFYSGDSDAAPGLVSLAGGVVTIQTDTGNEDADEDRPYVVVSEVRDNAVPPNYANAVFSYARDSKGPGITLSKSQSSIGNISTATVTVSVAGKISDANVIKTANLSIREVDGTCAASTDLSQGSTGRVVRNKRDLENDTNEIEFDESFTIRKPTGEGVGPETYCFWLASADIAVNSDGRGTGNEGNYELGSFTVGWPSTPVTPPGPALEFRALDNTAITSLDVAEGADTDNQYAVALANTTSTAATVSISTPAGVTVNPSSLTFPNADGTSDTLVVTVSIAHDLDIDSEAHALTHSATGFADGTLTVNANDDDFAISVNTPSVRENADAADVEVTVTAGTAAPSGGSQVTVQFGPGGSAANADFTAISDEAITILEGATSATATVSVDAVNDALQDEENESIELTGDGSTVQGVYIAPANIAILDDDPDIQLSLSPAEVNEDANTVTVTITATAGTPVNDIVQATITVADGTAESGDYNAASTSISLTINTAETTGVATVAVTIIDDADDESNETITFSAVNVTIGGDTYTFGDATLTIIDNDDT